MSITFNLKDDDLTWTEHEVLERRNEDIIALTVDALRSFAIPNKEPRTWTVDLHDTPVLPRGPRTFFVSETRENLDSVYPGPWFHDLDRIVKTDKHRHMLSWRGRKSNRTRIKLYNLAKLHPEKFDVDFAYYSGPGDGNCTLSMEEGDGCDPALASLVHSGKVLFVQDRKYWDYSAVVLNPENCVLVSHDLHDLLEKYEAVDTEKKSTLASNLARDVRERLSKQKINERIFSLIFKPS